jgi:hypothetical protein
LTTKIEKLTVADLKEARDKTRSSVWALEVPQYQRGLVWKIPKKCKLITAVELYLKKRI